MPSRELRTVTGDDTVGSVTFYNGRLTFKGIAESVFAYQLEQLGQTDLGTLLLDDGWSNGYLYLAPAGESARSRGGADPKGSLGAAVLADLQLRREDPYSPASLALDVRRELRHTPGGHMHNQLAHGGDLLDLAGRIELGDGETFLSSGRLDPDGAGSDPAADVLFAVVNTPRGTRVRVGVIPFEDVPRWRAGNKGGTADLDMGQVGEFHTRLSQMNGQAKAAAKRADDVWNTGSAPTDPVLAGTAPVEAGRIDSGWQPLRFEAWLTDDEPTAWQVSIEVGDDPTAEASTLDPKDTRKLIGKLTELSGEKRSLGAAALIGLQARREDPSDPAAMEPDLPDWDPDEPDPDRVHVPWDGPTATADDLDADRAMPDGLKGGARLKWYWTKGPGLAKWATKAHKWTALYHHLLKYMPPGKAKRTAAAWFHSALGYWPGHQKGSNPVGPG